MFEIFIAIAALCGNPSELRLREHEVLACQKYYVRCLNKVKTKLLVEGLAECVLNKQELGGSN